MLIHSPESEYAKERVKFEAQGSMMGPGLRPYVYREYPSWMYLAGIPAGAVGAPRIIDSTITDDDDQANNLASRGWRKKPDEAISAYEAKKLEEAKLAAEIEYDVVKKLSARAGAEVRAAQAEVDGHLASVPETPIRRRRGRPAKTGA